VCTPTFPIFRSGAILSASREASGADAVALGRRLRDESDEFTDELISFVQKNCRPFSVVRRAEVTRQSATRIRLYPAIIVDFPPLRIKWSGHEIDFRVCMTAWTGPRKSKIWTRYNLIRTQESKHDISDFFAVVAPQDKLIHEFCAKYYEAWTQRVFKESGKEIKVTPIYKIVLRMVSSADANVSRWIEERLETDKRQGADENSDRNLRERVTSLLRNEYALEPSLSKSDTSAKQFVRAFRYPLNSMKLLVDRADSSAQSSAQGDGNVDFDEMIFATVSSLQEVKSICVIETGTDTAEVTGIVYEPMVAAQFNASGTHIASAELIYGLGNLY